MKRKKYLHSLLSNLILNFDELNNDNKDYIINKMNTERQSNYNAASVSIKNEIRNDVEPRNFELNDSFNIDFLNKSKENNLDSYFQSFSINNLYKDKMSDDLFFFENNYDLTDQPLFHLIPFEKNDINENNKNYLI